MKRIKSAMSVLAIALAGVLLLSGCAGDKDAAVDEALDEAEVTSEEAPHSDFHTVMVEENTVEVVDYFGTGPVVEVPETVFGMTVVGIGSNAFEKEGIEEIILPDTVTYIAEYAFSGCTDLKRVDFGSGLKHVRDYAFYDCPNLESVVFPESLLSLGESIFGASEALAEVYIPGSVSEINTITTPEMCPNLVITVGEGGNSEFIAASTALPVVVRNASGEETVVEAPAPKDPDAVEDEKTVSVPEVKDEGVSSKDSTTTEADFQVESLGPGTCVVTGCTATDAYISVPEEIQGMKVIRIGSRAFEESEATVISIPDSVTYIESYAFSKCENLESVELSRYLEKVGALTFNECPALTQVIFPNGMTEFEGTPFGRCVSLQIVYIPDSVTVIPDSIAAQTLCPDVVVITPAGSMAEEVALDSGLPVSNETSGG